MIVDTKTSNESGRWAGWKRDARRVSRHAPLTRARAFNTKSCHLKYNFNLESWQITAMDCFIVSTAMNALLR
jgi:hypothetical protein